MSEAESDVAPLFCPFCGECFEGERQCPEHDIPLVPFQELDRLRGRPNPAEDEEVAFYDLRFGRGVVFGAAALMLLAFFLPVLASHYGNEVRVATGFDAASTVAMNLWVLPLVAITMVSIVTRRRTPASMRGVRLAIPALALLGGFSLGYTIWRVSEGAEKISRMYGQEVEVELRFGIWVAAVGVVLALLGGLRLGAMPKPKPPKYKISN